MLAKRNKNTLVLFKKWNSDLNPDKGYLHTEISISLLNEKNLKY